jgi:hypothetical protein
MSAFLDAALTVGSVWFNYGFIPQFRDPKTAVPRLYSIPSAVVMVALFMVPELSLGLRFAPASSALSALGFVALAIWKPTRGPEASA